MRDLEEVWAREVEQRSCAEGEEHRGPIEVTPKLQQSLSQDPASCRNPKNPSWCLIPGTTERIWAGFLQASWHVELSWVSHSFARRGFLLRSLCHPR